MLIDLNNLGLECSEDWVPFPVTDMDLGYWAGQEARNLAERYERDGQAADTARLERGLERAAADSRTRTPLAAFGWYLSGHHEVVALMEIDAILPDDTVPDVTLGWLAEHMRAGDFGEPDVRYLPLPLGDAVRIRENMAGERKWRFGARPVIRALTYGVRPPDTDGLLTMHVSWTEPVVDEPLEQIVDRIAATLSL
ncbi:MULTISPECIES: hypothetical protein [unclassified Streptomyces]|uniref:hypothetical protein n=1 Tax=unclassified Streptomyces TaxID=2593676 RepID=UPI0022565805|nr:hypothetical protein [Streptomyces sp. NBC_01500]MCX4548883.1 hypothetical protein [Streptomyces sp. NBC_01500]WSV54496.1 hypothetical protein OG282_12690 [Streptomyces sp. NBC_01014]